MSKTMTNKATKLAKVENGVLHINADVFIIPNSAVLTSECGYWADKRKRQMQQILTETTGESEEDIVVLQTWVVAEETLESENLGNHGGSFIAEDRKKHYIPSGRIGEHFPAKLFEGHTEGEVVDIKIPKGYDEFNQNFDIVLSLRLAQKEYRYRGFGNFEDVFRQVAGGKLAEAARMAVTA